ncbi:MAG: host attachment protein [Proteobacteria bacterium]|nr:host attachment protein [Pseudomonadota bacterium]
MSDYLIVVVNRALARFFTLEPVEFSELESGPRLIARAALENQEIRDAQEMFTDSKTGRGRGTAPRGGSVHGYDDKRHQHLDELRRRFAVRVIERIQELARIERVRTVILAASARMRRFLYPNLDTLTRQGYRVHKLSKNMINFSPKKIHEYLADDGLIPRQKKA